MSSETPLIQAVRAGDYHKALGLLVAGARMEEKSKDGETAFDMAMRQGGSMREVFRAHMICG